MIECRTRKPGSHARADLGGHRRQMKAPAERGDSQVARGRHFHKPPQRARTYSLVFRRAAFSSMKRRMSSAIASSFSHCSL